MGTYTGLRFKGIIKEEFRDDFEAIALRGAWKESSDEKFKNFGMDEHADNIPNYDEYSGYPEYWEYRTVEHKPVYVVETGYWEFMCSLKNYDKTIEHFFQLLPYFIDRTLVVEKYIECDDYVNSYCLTNGEVKLTNIRELEDYEI